MKTTDKLLREYSNLVNITRNEKQEKKFQELKKELVNRVKNK